MPQDQWIIKNNTQRYLSVGDLPRVPAIWPGKVVDLLNYYDQDRVSNSAALKTMLNNGWLEITKIKNGVYSQFDNTNEANKAITTAELKEQEDLGDRVTTVEDNQGAAQNFTATVVNTSSYTLDPDNDRYLLVNASGGNATINLPLAANADEKGIFHIKKTDSTSNTVTIDGNGSETIDGAATAVITIQFEAISIASDGTSWYIV